eukprot:CAMPEP_0113550080 /NCGR_PEP_ID=MMETSP0015_2-20120614/13788_1 /TAXON_ID=2838 /ORGANISM="Odontella" /LENGTH=360 /DNA_ID=CAMNT_0000450857 /DNA_START=145 /DNA_END=1227 /DNA_ORIENTATION=- /assembly_acc=CAM_ASM_000160
MSPRASDAVDEQEQIAPGRHPRGGGGERNDSSSTGEPAMTTATKTLSAESSTIREAEGRRVPLPLRPWIASYRCVPRIDIPLTNLSVSFTFLSAALLIAIRLFVEWTLPRYFGWPSDGHKITEEAAACMVSGVQATFLLGGLGACLFSQPYRPSARMEDHPSWWRDGANALIEFCTGYMIYDAVLLVGKAWMKGESIPAGDIMYIGHHFATSYMMMGVRIMGAGHLSAMYLMFTGEMTSPLMNSHFVLRLAVRLKCCSGPLVHECLAYVEYAYAILYCVCRIVLGPVGAAHLTYDLLFTKKGRRNVNVIVALTWMPMVWGVLVGSRPWIEEAVEMLGDGLAVVKYGPEYDLGEAYRHDEL